MNRAGYGLPGRGLQSPHKLPRRRCNGPGRGTEGVTSMQGQRTSQMSDGQLTEATVLARIIHTVEHGLPHLPADSAWRKVLESDVAVLRHHHQSLLRGQDSPPGRGLVLFATTYTIRKPPRKPCRKRRITHALRTSGRSWRRGHGRS